MGRHFSFTVVVPVPLYAVEKLARLFFPLALPLSLPLFHPCRGTSAESEREGLRVGLHRTFGPRPGLSDGEEMAEEGAFTSSFSVSEVSIDPSANEFCNPIKTFPRRRNKVPPRVISIFPDRVRRHASTALPERGLPIES